MFELVLPGRRLPVVGVDGAPYGPGPAWHVRPGADAARALRVDDGTPPVHADAEDREPADRPGCVPPARIPAGGGATVAGPRVAPGGARPRRTCAPRSRVTAHPTARRSEIPTGEGAVECRPPLVAVPAKEAPVYVVP